VPSKKDELEALKISIESYAACNTIAAMFWLGAKAVVVERKSESILDLLAEAPWWVSVAASVAAFAVLRYIQPAVCGENLAAKALAR
jgi:hypothetical protein